MWGPSYKIKIDIEKKTLAIKLNAVFVVNPHLNLGLFERV